MADLNSALSQPGKTSKTETLFNGVNANAVLHRLLQELSPEMRKDIVLRCEELPLLQGTEDEIQQIFSSLLKIILEKKDAVNRLFLHIHCAMAKEEHLPDPRWNRYTIQFNSNLIPSASWMEAHAQQVKEISAILQKNHGSLEVANVASQGCIFSLSLPGKPI